MRADAGCVGKSRQVILRANARNGPLAFRVLTHPPTFARLSPPMADMCRFISFATLRNHLERAAPFLRHLKPDFLDAMSESCAIDDA